MKSKLVFLICILGIGIGIAGCSKKDDKISIVLDWTPNTNHTGLYVAQELGYFEELGLNVDIIQPPEGGATTLVASGKAEFGIDFQDSIAPAFATDEPLPVTAVATLIQHNTSGIISLKDNGIDTPKGMADKVYATWDLPVEKAIIRQVVEADGGDYNAINMIPSTVADVITALNTNVDAVWVYYAWDGIATKVKGIETDYFAFKDIDPVLDYYNPIIVSNNTYLEKNEEQAKAVLKAVAKGYEYAIENPEDAANILVKANPELDMAIVQESQKWLADQYKAEVSQWGYIDANRWDNFYQWLSQKNLIEQEIPLGYGFTNKYLSE
ncbi:MAG TPA: ABC transporter substrate-binding protein [Epulopiscium sp.]|nr:ABC transporter substrate-binding protein [Candidatus Epulonipiscium sp.]